MEPGINEKITLMMYAKAKKIDDGVFMALRPKPKWLPTFIWHKLIEMLININHFIS